MQPSIVGFSMEGASNALRSWQCWPGGDAVNDFTIDGAASVSQGSADDPKCYQGAKKEVYELVTNLLATMGAPAFLDNDDGDDVGGSMDIISFATPYGFVGSNPNCIAPDDLIIIIIHPWCPWWAYCKTGLIWLWVACKWAQWFQCRWQVEGWRTLSRCGGDRNIFW